MKVVRILSVVALAAFLIFQGIGYLSETVSPMMMSLQGLLALISGVLMFISISHWANYKSERR